MESIKAIQSLLQNAPVSELDNLIEAYSADERSGVISALDRARKRIAAWETELERTNVMYTYETQYEAYTYICGIDEVGRGPLAGPVVAGAVVLPKDHKIPYLNDSKKLSEKKREELFQVIQEEAVAIGIGMRSPERIDEINILQATYEAMQDAVARLQVVPDLLLNDAVTIPKLSMKQIPIIKGDAKSASIAAASIYAKVTRDHMMAEYAKEYPEYDFASNKGYGSQTHIDAIRKYGPCPIHRRSFISNFLDK